MTLNIATLIIIILNLSPCLTIMDKINYNKYCPKNNTCKPPESHLVCKFVKFVKTNDMVCTNHKPRTFTQSDVKRLLVEINKIRGSVATGKEKVKGGKNLPKAYGMFRVNWDKELAGLADLMLRNGNDKSWYICAATGKYTQPSLSANVDAATPKIDPIASIAKIWTNLKNSVQLQDIRKCPDLKTSPVKHYIRLIQGVVSGVGCSTATCDTSATNKKRIVKLVCYFSHWTKTGTPVYKTDPPRPGSGYTSKCGCPPGYGEDINCLCQELSILTTSTAAMYHSKKLRHEDLTAYFNTRADYTEPLEIRQWWATPRLRGVTDAPTSENPISTRKPKIVFLPVFAVTRSNSDVIPHRRRFNYMSSTSHTKSIHVINFFKDYEIENAYRKSTLKTTIASETEFHNTKLRFRTPDLTTDILNENIFEHQRPLRRNNYANYYGNTIKENLKEIHRNTMLPLDILEQKNRHVKHSSYEMNFFSDNVKTTRQDVLNNRQNENIQFPNSDSAAIPSDIEKDFEELKNFLTYKTNHDNATRSRA